MAKKAGYTKKELYSRGPQITYSGRNLDEVAFPLGGIGAGMVTLGGWGQLRDFEIRNRPDKGDVIPNTFFAIRCKQGKTDVTKVLQGQVEGCFTGKAQGTAAFSGEGHSARFSTGEGFPHFRKSTFRGEYPFAFMEMSDAGMPVAVKLTAWNPFIPLNEDDSSIPAAILSYTLKNTTKSAVEVMVYGSTSNRIGKAPSTPLGIRMTAEEKPEGRKNTARRGAGLSGLYMTNERIDTEATAFGTMALAVLGREAVTHAAWEDDQVIRLFEGMAQTQWPPKKAKGQQQTGTLGVPVKLAAGETATVTFVLSWHFPNYERYWGNAECACGSEECKPPQWKNWYASRWSDAWDVAGYVAGNFERLEAETKAFHKALFSSTIPDYVLDAVSANISILKSPTCIRLSDGTFYGFEGCNNTSGCCDGSCTHVWNYSQAQAYLFPALARSQREADYKYAQRKDGCGEFRIPLPLGTKPAFKFHPAADGQMGAVMQVYREWLVSGDSKWLKSMWPATKRSLEFAWKFWDADRDGVMEGVQHNTYDIEYYGPNTMMGSLYLGALAAGEKMALAAGDKEAAKEYKRLLKKGSAWTDKNLWNGEYYEQKVRPDAYKNYQEPFKTNTLSRGGDGKFAKWPKWQYGKGCLSDQLIGQWYSRMLGLGDLYDGKKVKKALKSVFAYNWKKDLTDHPALFRLYALRDEAGLIICTWPKGGRPGYPTLYGDEVWCGIEYQVASHLIYEGFVDEGLTITRGVRERHRGDRRNPWDEFECGHHYARSMASYAVMTALAGFSYNGVEGRMGFAPRVSEKEFKVFWSVGSGWGTYAQSVSGGKTKVTVEVVYGKLELSRLDIGVKAARKASARAGGKRVEATAKKTRDGVSVIFAGPVTAKAGEKIVVEM